MGCGISVAPGWTEFGGTTCKVHKQVFTKCGTNSNELFCDTCIRNQADQSNTRCDILDITDYVKSGNFRKRKFQLKDNITSKETEVQALLGSMSRNKRDLKTQKQSSERRIVNFKKEFRALLEQLCDALLESVKRKHTEACYMVDEGCQRINMAHKFLIEQHACFETFREDESISTLLNIIEMEKTVTELANGIDENRPIELQLEIYNNLSLSSEYLGVVSHKRQPNKVAKICVTEQEYGSDVSESSNVPGNKARPLAGVTTFHTPSSSGRPTLSRRQRTKVSEGTATSCSVARSHLTRASTTRPSRISLKHLSDRETAILVAEISLPKQERNNRNITGSVILANGYTVLCDRNNRQLCLFDSDFKLKADLFFDYSPYDICMITDWSEVLGAKLQ